MVKVRIHIYNEQGYCDEHVCLDTVLPHLPRIGDHVWLRETDQEELERQIKSDLKFANDYLRYFYGESRQIEEATAESLKDVSIDDCIFVVGVLFKVGEDFVHIELADNDIENLH